jgi:hypothetical protein
MPDRETKVVHIKSNSKIVYIGLYDGLAKLLHYMMLDQMSYNERWSDIRIILRHKAYINHENAKGVIFLS